MICGGYTVSLREKLLLFSQHNATDVVYGLGVYGLGLTEDVALGVYELGLSEDVALGVHALGLTKDVALGVNELGLTEMKLWEFMHWVCLRCSFGSLCIVFD